ncbi:hypothetical protein WCP94_000086 (plasmid) [Bilophila wadsworthia]
MRFAKRSQAAGAKKGSLAERFLLFLIHMQEKRFLPGRRDVGRLPVAAALGVGKGGPSFRQAMHRWREGGCGGLKKCAVKCNIIK